MRVPDLPTQRRIAGFLDRETARIDRLIEKKQRLTALLGERRKSTIHNLVLGGAHDTSSRVEGAGSGDRGFVAGGGGVRPDWLSNMPSAWTSVPFGSIFTQSKRKNSRLQRDFVLSVMKDLGVIPYTEKGNVGNKVSDDLSGYKLVDKGDFVLNSMNLYMGSVGVSAYNGVTSTAYIVCKPSENVYAGYYNYLIQFKGFQEYVGLLGKGIMEIREAVRWTALKSVFVPLPDLPTQRRIAGFLDRETARIDRLIEKNDQSINRLREYRSALITAAVTGQIDVMTDAQSGSPDRCLNAIQKEMNT